MDRALDARLDALNAEAYGMAGRGLEAERVALMDSLLGLYHEAYPGAGTRPPVPADTIAAKAYARLARARWVMGDTTGAVEAYEDGLIYFFLLPDSLRMDRLRRVGYTAGLVDPARGFRWLDAIERESRARGLNSAAELAAHCKLDLIRRLDSLGLPVPAMEPVGQHGGAPFLLYGLFVALCVGLTLLGARAWGAWGPARRRIPPYLYRR